MKRVILVVLIFHFVVLIFSKKTIPLPDLGIPQTIAIDNNRIFIIQAPEIYIYSLEDFKLLDKFGKKGEGPGEFISSGAWTMYLDILPEEILLSSVSRISFFTKDGNFIRMKKINPMVQTFYRIKPLGNKFVGVLREPEDGLLKSWFYIFDSDFKPLKKLSICSTRRRDGKFCPIAQSPILANFDVYDNKIFLSENVNKEGILQVFDNNGKKLYSINNNYEKIKFKKEHKRSYLSQYKKPIEKEYLERMKHFWIFPEYFPAWQNFLIDNNKIYLQTFKRNKKDSENEFIMLNMDGNLIKKIWIPLKEYLDFTPDPYTLYDKKQQALSII